MKGMLIPESAEHAGKEEDEVELVSVLLLLINTSWMMYEFMNGSSGGCVKGGEGHP